MVNASATTALTSSICPINVDKVVTSSPLLLLIRINHRLIIVLILVVALQLTFLLLDLKLALEQI